MGFQSSSFGRSRTIEIGRVEKVWSLMQRFRSARYTSKTRGWIKSSSGPHFSTEEDENEEDLVCNSQNGVDEGWRGNNIWAGERPWIYDLHLQFLKGRGDNTKWEDQRTKDGTCGTDHLRNEGARERRRGDENLPCEVGGVKKQQHHQSNNNNNNNNNQNQGAAGMMRATREAIDEA